MRDARVDQVATRIGLWVFGALLAVMFAAAPSLLPLSVGALGVFVVAALTLGGPARSAFAGGTSTTLGAIFLYFTQLSIENCARFNRQPGGGCTMGDSTPFVLIALLFLAIGLVLSSLALRPLPR